MTYNIAFHHASKHGVLTAVHIPDAPDEVPEEILARLPAGEARHARTLRGYRQPQFVGGRLAIRAAAQQLGVRPPAILSDERGAPVIPAPWVGSVSHKRTLAIGMVAHSREGTLGVDIEDYGPARPTIETSVLTERERESLEPLDAKTRWIATVVRFSIKESIYKALDPYVHRYVGFHEAEVWPDVSGRAAVELKLSGGEGPFQVDARFAWLHGRIVSSVRILQGAIEQENPPVPDEARRE